MKPISFDTHEAIGSAVSFQALVDSNLRYCRNYFPEAEDSEVVDGETVTTPHEYESSTIHVFDGNIIADWDSTNLCTYQNTIVYTSGTASHSAGEIRSLSGYNLAIAYVVQGMKYQIYTATNEVASCFFYTEKPSVENWESTVIIDDTTNEPVRQGFRRGKAGVCPVTGWMAFVCKTPTSENITPIVIQTDTDLTNEQMSAFGDPNEVTDTVTFDTPIEGHNIGDTPYAYYDWVTGALTDGERFYPIEEPPFIPFNVSGYYYIYFDEGIANVSYLTWNQEDRLYRFILNQEDRIPVLTDNDDNPIAGIVLEPETGFDERETPIDIPNLERKE